MEYLSNSAQAKVAGSGEYRGEGWENGVREDWKADHKDPEEHTECNSEPLEASQQRDDLS